MSSHLSRASVVALAFAVMSLGCNSNEKSATPPAASPASTTQSNSAQTTTSTSPIGEGAHAEVGKPAPDFTLKDLDGKEVRLSSFKGKTVVLEWFNPGCPFVNKAHTKGSLKETAAKHVKNGVVWLAINSGGAGKQGFGVDANREGAKTFALSHPILLDESGAVGHAYAATNTPHMMVIDDKGTLVYRGAIDNSPDGEGESPQGGKLVNYVDTTLEALAAGKPVATAETKAYGCAVKFAK